jgi:uncharacterized membrane protein
MEEWFRMRTLNLAAAIVVHAIAGLGFIGFATAGGGPSGFGVFLATVLWIAGLALMVEWRNTAPGRVWLVPIVWPFAGWIFPLGVLTLIGLVYYFAVRGREGKPAMRSPGAGSTAYNRKLQAVLMAAEMLEQQVREAIALAPSARPAPAPAAPPAAPTLAPAFRPRPRATAAPVPPAPKPKAPPKPQREIDWSLFLGARALAWAGGVVMVLGIVFFFVLAANRGWLTHELRIGLGGFTSIAVFGVGLWLKRRFGSLYAALAAVSAGLAGAYATLLAATALYEFVPQVWALVAAAGIAAVGVVVAIAWSAQTVAGLGLIGAMVVPLMVVVDEHRLSFVGTCFVAIVFTAAAVVAHRMGWRNVLLAAATASLPQIAVLVAETHALTWWVIALAAVFWLLYVGAGIARQLRFGAGALEPAAGALVIAGAALAAYSCAFLFDGDTLGLRREGISLFVVSAAHAALAAFFFSRRPLRDLSSVLWAVALVLGAVSAGELFAGASLTAVWAAVAVLLLWLAEHTGELRLRLPAFAYLLLALGDAVIVESPPRDLFVAVRHPAGGTPALIAAAAAFAGFAWYARSRAGAEEGGAVSRLLADLARALERLRPAYLWASGVLVLYAASLSLLELSAWIRVDELDTRFARGHVAVHGLWALVAVALVEIGLRLRRRQPEIGGLVLLALAVASSLAFAAPELPETERSLLFLAVAAGALLAGFEHARLSPRRLRLLPAGAAIVTSALLAAAAVVALAHGDWHGLVVEGAALAGLALVFAAFSVPVLRSQRDLSTLLWALALALALAALAELLSGRWLVLAGAALVALLALLARFGREPRLQAGAALTFVLALAYALWVEAPPRELFVAVAHPGGGVPALLFLAAAAGVFAYGRELVRQARSVALGAVGTVLFYAVSLSILELAELATDADVDTKFQRGHTGVSAFWGLVSLAFLYLGLTRRSRALRLGGFALFGVTLAKIFLYDLAFLSSLTRAFSFIAVGAVLLLAGFFYQRLSEQLEERGRTRAPGSPPDNAAA